MPRVSLRTLLYHACCLCWLLAIAIPVWGAGETAAPGQAGVGLRVVPIATGELVVLAVLPHSPAQQAGIEAGDLVVAVDGLRLRGSHFEEIVKKYLWGKPGSRVTVTSLRPGVAGAQTVTLVRAVLTSDNNAPPELKMITPATGGKP